MLIRKSCDEFLVDTSKAGKVLDEDCQVFTLLLQISPQLSKDRLGVLAGNVGTPLNNVSRKSIEVVNEFFDFNFITVYTSGPR